MLVAFVPLSTDFAEKHRPLIGPAQLQESDFADVGAKPASVFDIVPVSLSVAW